MRTRFSPFRLAGLIGFGAACTLATALARQSGLSLRIVAALAISGGLVFLALAMLTRIVSGAESLTYYHHQTAVLVTSALVLWRIHAPLLPYLDITALGIGALLACGRIGCLLEGCCHGLPSAWGVHYGRDCIDTGFPPHLAGVRLFPVQAVEAFWVLATVCLGALIVFRGYPPGSAFSSYLVLYATGRFFLELLRGDPDRPYPGSFSEAQWTSIAIIGCVVCAEMSGVLPSHAWHWIVAGLTAFAALALLAHPGLRRLRRVFHPLHVREFAEALELVTNLSAEEAYRSSLRPPAVNLACTALGIRISAGQLQQGETLVRHFTVSAAGEMMTSCLARRLASLSCSLTGAPQKAAIVAGRQGTFHFLIQDKPPGIDSAPGNDKLPRVRGQSGILRMLVRM